MKYFIFTIFIYINIIIDIQTIELKKSNLNYKNSSNDIIIEDIYCENNYYSNDQNCPHTILIKNSIIPVNNTMTLYRQQFSHSCVCDCYCDCDVVETKSTKYNITKSINEFQYHSNSVDYLSNPTCFKYYLNENISSCCINFPARKQIKKIVPIY